MAKVQAGSSRSSAYRHTSAPPSVERRDDPIDRPLGLHTELKVGAAEDALEHEADRVAEHILAAEPEHRRVRHEDERRTKGTEPGAIIRRKCSRCAGDLEPEGTIRRKCARCSESDERGSLAPRATFDDRLGRARAAGGRPLDVETRQFMESRFDADFSRVRVHTGSAPAGLAQEIRARAFTLGRDLFFNSGEFHPRERAGRALLAHELTHVVQQGGAPSRTIRRAPLDEPQPQPARSRNPGNWTALWACAATESEVVQVPGPGTFYQVQPGDTLLTIAERMATTTAPEERVAIARVINDQPCNVKFHRKNARDRDIFFGTQIAMEARFADTVEAQTASVDGGKGRRRPVVRIPPVHYTSDGRFDRSGIPTQASAAGSSFIGDSCAQYVDLVDPSRQCNYVPMLESAWENAAQAAAIAYARFPRADVGLTPGASLPRGLEYFGLDRSRLKDPKNAPLLQEIRANLASIGAILQGRGLTVECDSGGGEVSPFCENSDANGTVADASAPGVIAVCPRFLRGPPSRMKPTKCKELSNNLIHETAHHTVIGPRDFAYDTNLPALRALPLDEAASNPDSYAQYIEENAPACPDGTPTCSR